MQSKTSKGKILKPKFENKVILTTRDRRSLREEFTQRDEGETLAVKKLDLGLNVTKQHYVDHCIDNDKEVDFQQIDEEQDPE